MPSSVTVPESFGHGLEKQFVLIHTGIHDWRLIWPATGYIPQPESNFAKSIINRREPEVSDEVLMHCSPPFRIGEKGLRPLIANGFHPSANTAFVRFAALYQRRSGLSCPPLRSAVAAIFQLMVRLAESACCSRHWFRSSNHAAGLAGCGVYSNRRVRLAVAIQITDRPDDFPVEIRLQCDAVSSGGRVPFIQPQRCFTCRGVVNQQDIGHLVEIEIGGCHYFSNWDR